MGKKAVYGSQVLAVYITRDDLDSCLLSGVLHLPVFIEKDMIPHAQAILVLDWQTIQTLRRYVEAERGAIARVRQRAEQHKRQASLTYPEDVKE